MQEYWLYHVPAIHLFIVNSPYVHVLLHIVLFKNIFENKTKQQVNLQHTATHLCLFAYDRFERSVALCFVFFVRVLCTNKKAHNFVTWFAFIEKQSAKPDFSYDNTFVIDHISHDVCACIISVCSVHAYMCTRVLFCNKIIKKIATFSMKRFYVTNHVFCLCWFQFCLFVLIFCFLPQQISWCRCTIIDHTKI